MKLISFFTAILISLSVFSQDLIEYNDGTFSSNGEELSINEVKQLTKEFKLGLYAKALLYDGKRFNNRANNRLYRNSIAIITVGIGGYISYGCIVAGDVAKELFDWRGLQITLYGLGAAIIPATIYASLKLSKPDYWLNQRDECFKRLARELNQAVIQSEVNQ